MAAQHPWEVDDDDHRRDGTRRSPQSGSRSRTGLLFHSPTKTHQHELAETRLRSWGPAQSGWIRLALRPVPVPGVGSVAAGWAAGLLSPETYERPHGAGQAPTRPLRSPRPTTVTGEDPTPDYPHDYPCPLHRAAADDSALRSRVAPRWGVSPGTSRCPGREAPAIPRPTRTPTRVSGGRRSRFLRRPRDFTGMSESCLHTTNKI